MTHPQAADLHLHTFYSDGTFSPEEVIERAKAIGLGTVSITDHDTCEALPRAIEAAAGGIEVIPGVELTAVFKERELHILGYGLRIEEPALRTFFSQMASYRVQRIQAMIDRLGARGITVTLEEVRAIAGEGTMGRPHLAEALMKRGVVRSLDEAFQQYLGDKAPCFVKGATLTVPKAAEVLHRAGAVAVLAHPHRMVEDSWIPELVGAGIQGIEVYHPDHDSGVAKKYLRMTQHHRLLVTGGSDCHGLRKSGGPSIGCVTVPSTHAERLKEAIRDQRSNAPTG